VNRFTLFSTTSPTNCKRIELTDTVCIKIAFPEKLGKYGVQDFVRERLGAYVDLESRNRCQRIGKYDFVIMRTRMVPYAVERDVFTGIVGRDWLYDYVLANPKTDLRIVERLPVGKAKVVAFKKKDSILGIAPRIITPYTNLSKQYVEDRQLKYANIEYAPGETEGWVKAGLADLGIDNINSGKTIEETGLEIIDKILDSYAVIVAKKDDVDIARKIWGLT